MDANLSSQRSLSAFFAGRKEVILAYLFGSQVEGATGPLSDYDIGVLVNCSEMETPTDYRARLAHELVRVLDGEDVDLLLLHEAPIELAYRVIAQGEVLHEVHLKERVEYEAYVLGRYGDLLPMLRAQREAIIDDPSHDHRVQRYRAALRRTERTLDALTASSGEGEGGV